jgi:integration host factor subunit alpha
MTLTKANIVNLLKEQLGLPKKDCLKIVNAYFEEISKGLEKGEEIKIPKFGNFVVKHKKSRPGRNPKTGEPHKISDRNVVSFKASKKLRESL